MKFTIEFEQEVDGRWIAEVIEIPGVIVYGKTPDDAIAHAKALALRVVADEIENSERSSEMTEIFFATAA
jgi:predicted RNase H-like HicB family nuclease